MRHILVLLLALISSAGSLAAGSRGDVLVFGASGQLGSEVVGHLLASGYRVTAFVRASSDRTAIDKPGVEFAVGDMLNAADVTAALARHRFVAVVDASARGSAGDDFYPTAMRHIVSAARAAGSPRIILHGSVGAGDNMKLFPQAPFGRMAATLMAKGEAEKVLQESGLTWAIIRNGILMPAGTPATGKAALSDDQHLMRSVTRADLARLTVDCLADNGCFGHVWHAVDESLPFPDRYR